MQPTGGSGVANRFARGHSEGDDIMLHARFEFVDARDVHLGARSNRCRGFLRHLTRLRESFGSGDFDLKPFRKAVGVAPDVAHLWARVAWNQFPLLKRKNKKCECRPGFPNSMIPQMAETAAGRMKRRCPESGWRVSQAGMRGLSGRQ